MFKIRTKNKVSEIKKRKGIIITPLLQNNSGGYLLSQLFIDFIKSNFIIVSEIKIPLFTNNKEKLAYYFKGEIVNITRKEEKEILNLILTNNDIEYVFVNHSYYGNIITKIKNLKTKIKIITFFHNVEAIFTFEAFKTTKNPGTYIGYLLTRNLEKKLVNISNIIITLNKRDSDNLEKLYGRPADYIIPLAIKDKLNCQHNRESLTEYKLPKHYSLFVGSNFYANVDGLKWFAKNVSPHINIPVVVVGLGMESLKEEFSKYPNIIIIGSVDNLYPFYLNADFVISPIFKGSGMKTKTAEALMYEKSIIGSREAFEGFDIPEDIGICCNSTSEFILNYNKNTLPKINKISRSLFEKLYSVEAFNRALHKALNSL